MGYGTIGMLASGLVVRYVQSVTAAGDGRDLDTQTWLTVCRNAVPMRRGEGRAMLKRFHFD